MYCMAINPRRQQLVCGVNEGVRVYALDEGNCFSDILLIFHLHIEKDVEQMIEILVSSVCLCVAACKIVSC